MSIDYQEIISLGLARDKKAVNSLLKMLNEAESLSDNFGKECVITALARIGDPHASTSIVVYLKDENDSVRRTTEWALGKIGGKTDADLLIQYLDSPDWRMIAWALGEMGDPRGIEQLINFFREQDYFVKVGSTVPISHPTHNQLYGLYTKERATHYPQQSFDVITATAFAFEDLLVQLGVPAKEGLIRALNKGGINNDNLVFPLRRLSWTPSNDTERFFYLIADPDVRFEQLRETFLEPVRKLKSINNEALIRSLPNLSGVNYTLGFFLGRMVKEGLVPVWENLETPNKYDKRTVRALCSFCEELIHEKIEPDLANRIQQALSKCKSDQLTL